MHIARSLRSSSSAAATKMGRCRSFAHLALWALCIGVASAWKKDEFRRCDQSKFCKEARERGAGSSRIQVRDVRLEDGRVTGKLVPMVAQEGQQVGGALVLEISAYKDGIVRVRVDEEEGGPRKRFEVPDVVVRDLEEKRLWIPRIIERGGSSVMHLSGYEVILQRKPFQVSCVRSYVRALCVLRSLQSQALSFCSSIASPLCAFNFLVGFRMVPFRPAHAVMVK